VRFRYTIEAVAGAIGLCHWHRAFTRVGSGERVELEGIFRCARFDEWWHRRTLDPGRA
jgi:hypothetical protein